MKSGVIFGAGAIGLAFLGDLLDQSGYRLVFADVRDDIIRWLDEKGEYTIRIADGRGERLRTIRNVRALNSSGYGKDAAVTEAVRREIIAADIIFTAAGEAALAPIGRLLGDALRSRTEAVNIICCENIKDPAGVLRDAIGAATSGVGISRSVISRMTPVVADPRNIVTEPYAQIPVEGRTWLGAPPDIVGLRLVDDFEAYKMQKLIMHNMTHAVAAYIGYFLGKKDIHECMRDELIARACRGALDEAARIMRAEYGLPEDELRRHADDLFSRYDNPALGHTVPNVARDPMRKLAPGDRFHSAMTLAEKNGIAAPHAELGVAFALNYDEPGDVSACKLQEMIASDGIEAVIARCGIARSSSGRLVELYNRAGSAISSGPDAVRRMIETALRRKCEMET